MYTKALREFYLSNYACLKVNAAKFFRFQFPHDPKAPKNWVAHPGPKHLEANEDINHPISSKVDNYFADQRFLNIKQSKGSYFKDIDGNTVLDMNAGQAGFILGYNPDDLTNWRMGSTLYDQYVTHKVNLSQLPPLEAADKVREHMMPHAPEGLAQVHLGGGNTGCGANEQAISAALKHYSEGHGTPVENLTVLGFDNSNHGDTPALMSCSSDRVNPHGLPTYNWPRAEFPDIKYPMPTYEKHNRAEEDRCLEAVQNLVQTQKGSGKEVGAIIVEPISSFDNQMATPYFYRQLRRYAKLHGIPFIVDETKTGMGSSGKKWAHEHWYLSGDEVPDFVTFGGKAGLSGFYSTVNHRLGANTLAQNINMIKLLNYGWMWQLIEKQGLLQYTTDVGSFLKIELDRVGKEQGFITNVRGLGTHIGFDMPTPELTDSMQKWLMRGGIHALKCGPRTIGLRPALTFSPEDGGVLRDQLMHFNPNFEK